MIAALQNEVFVLPILIWNWDRFQSSFMGLKIVLHLGIGYLVGFCS